MSGAPCQNKIIEARNPHQAGEVLLKPMDDGCVLTQNGAFMESGLQHVHTACASTENPRTRSTYLVRQFLQRMNTTYQMTSIKRLYQ